MLRALIFDLDGTLAETEEYHRQAFNDAFAAAYAEDIVAATTAADVAAPAAAPATPVWSVAQYRDLLKVAGGKERIAAYFAARGQALSATQVRQLHERKNARYAQLLASAGVCLRPGVRRLFGQARDAGVALAIATTTSPENLAALLAPALGASWRCGFAAIVAGDAPGRKKPAPDVYLHCLERLGITAAQAIAVEDSAVGLRSAQAAGIRVLVTPSLYSAEDDFGAADRLVPHLGDPATPWDHPVPGFERPYVQLTDLAALCLDQGSARQTPE